MAKETPQFSREELIREAWIRGRLHYKLKPYQKKIYRAYWDVIDGKIDARTFVLLISRQLGKSFTSILVAIEFCIRQTNVQVRYAIPFAVKFPDIALLSIKRILNDCPDDLKPQVKESEKRIVFKNGSQICFAGTDRDPDALRGAASHLNIMDECGFMGDPLDIFQSILHPQTRTTGGKTFFVTTPPEAADHTFSQIHHEHKERDHCLKMTIYDSDMSEDQIDAEAIVYGGKTSTRFLREFCCEFVTDSELSVISEWNADFVAQHNLVTEIEHDQLFQYYHKYICMDTGVKDLTVALFAYYHFPTARLIVEDEVVMNGTEMTTEKLQKEIKATKQQLWGEHPVYRHIADSNNQQIINDLNLSYKLPFVGVSKTRLLSTGREGIEPGMVNKTKIMVGQGRIIVSPKCEQLLGCLEFGVWQKGKRGEMLGRSRQFGHYDALMALIYLVLSIDQHTNPIPAALGLSRETHFISPRLVENKKSKEWGKLLATPPKYQNNKRNSFK